MNIKRLSIFCAAATIAATSVFAEEENKAVSIAGSDLIYPYIADTAKELALKEGVNVEFKMWGTFSAFEEMAKNGADIAIVAIPRGTQVPEGFEAMPFAFQTAIVVVNSVNPIEEISDTQLFDIFSNDTKKRTETWQQMGVHNIGLPNIVPIITSFSDNIVVELFKYATLKSTNIGQWVTIAKDKQTIFSMVKANTSAIGIVGKLTDTNMLKALPVAATKHEVRGYAFPPTRESIFNGDYPLALPFYVVYKKGESEKIKKIARVLLSDSVAEKVDTSDFVSAPESSRKKSIFDLDIGK